MTSWLKHNRFAIFRRITQIGLLVLFLGANYYSWKIIQGNYSSALLFESFYLTDPYAVLQTLFAGFIVSSAALIGAGIIVVLYAFIFGRVFCSWICPVNIIADLADYIRRTFRIQNSKLGDLLKHQYKYYIMIGFVLLSTILGAAAFELISPVAMVHRGIIFGSGFGLSFIIGILLFDISLKSYAWCGNLCPLGGFYSLISGLRILRVHHLKENCTNCNKCFTVCPEVQVLDRIGKSSGNINSGACTSCARCIEVCDDKALNFSLIKLKK